MAPIMTPLQNPAISTTLKSSSASTLGNDDPGQAEAAEAEVAATAAAMEDTGDAKPHPPTEPPTYTHTHTYTRAHTHTHTRTRTPSRAHTHTHAHTSQGSAAAYRMMPERVYESTNLCKSISRRMLGAAPACYCAQSQFRMTSTNFSYG